jgi:hypothetical protein
VAIRQQKVTLKETPFFAGAAGGSPIPRIPAAGTQDRVGISRPQIFDENMKSKSQLGTKVEQLKAESLKIQETLRICDQAWEAVGDLIRLAEEGDQLSISLLDIIATQTIGALNKLAQEKPDLLRPLARNAFTWPGLISGKRSLRRSNED